MKLHFSPLARSTATRVAFYEAGARNGPPRDSNLTKGAEMTLSLPTHEPLSLATPTSRRAILAMGAASLVAAGCGFTSTGPRTTPKGGSDLNTTSSYGGGTLPKGVRSRMIHGVNGLDVHILEAGYESSGRPLVLLLHGFPDLAYGWRHLIPILADAGYHVVAPDQRGFGRTTGWANGYDADLAGC
jgi:hypothetical protein